MTWVNLWGFRPFAYLLDAEVLNLETGVDFGLYNRFEIDFSYNSVRAGGGIMDSFIEHFHDTFHFDDYGRPDFPRNVFELEFYNKRGEKYTYASDDRTPKECYRGASLTLKGTLFDEKWFFPECAVFVSYKYGGERSHMPAPTNSEDLGFGLLVGKHFTHLSLYLNVGQFNFKNPRFGVIRLRKSQRDLFTGIEYRLNDSVALMLQVLTISKAAVDFYDFSRTTTEIVAGLRWEFSEKAALDFGIIENLFQYFNSPDVGMHVGLVYAF